MNMVADIGILAPLMVWNIWISHNKFIFGEDSPGEVLYYSCNQHRVASLEKCFWGRLLLSHPRMVHEVCWKKKKSDVDTMVLNVDGTGQTNP